MNENRLEFIDMTKGIGILLVVILHSTYGSPWFLTFISSFVMPLFFLISGILMKQTNGVTRPFKQSAFNKAKSMLVPYMFFSILYFVINLVWFLIHKEGRELPQISDYLLYTISFYGKSVLWFLPALFLGEIVVLGILKKYPLVVTVVIGFCLSGSALFGIKLWNQYSVKDFTYFGQIGYLFTGTILRGLVIIPFILAGYCGAYVIIKKEEVMSQNRNKIKVLLELTIALVFLGINLIITYFNGRIDLHFVVIHNPILCFVGACAGSLSLLLCCKHIKNIKYLNFLGRNSLFIMLTHADCCVLIIAIKLSEALTGLFTNAPSVFYFISMGCFVLFMETVGIFIVNRYFGFLLGKFKRKCNVIK